MIQLSGPGATRTGAGNDYEVLDLATCKTLIRDPGTENDTLLQRLLDAVHQGALELTGGRIFRVSATPYVHVVSSRGGARLRFPQWPVSTFTSVSEGNLIDAAGTWGETDTFTSADYYVDKAQGFLYAINNRQWSSGTLNHLLTYTAGYATGQVPGRLLEGLAEWVGALLKRSDKKLWDVVSETFNAESKTYVLSGLPKSTEDVLRGYRREVAFIG